VSDVTILVCLVFGIDFSVITLGFGAFSRKILGSICSGGSARSGGMSCFPLTVLGILACTSQHRAMLHRSKPKASRDPQNR